MEKIDIEDQEEQVEQAQADKKVPILEELRIAVENYELEGDDFSKSNHIINEDIGAYMMFGAIGRTPVSKQALY